METLRLQSSRAARPAFLTVVTLLAGLAGASVAAAASGEVTRRSSTQLGVHTRQLDERGVKALEGRIGRNIGIVHGYVQWGGAFDAAWARTAAAAGRTVLVTWEPWRPPSDYTPLPGATGTQPEFRLSRIAAGHFDPYVREFARAVAAHPGLVHLRPMHEMNGNWYPWAGGANGNDAETYRRAWRHLHGLFAREGATNVRWVFSVNAEDVPASNRFERYYPGRRYVDTLAVDGYNWGAARPDYGGWRSFAEIFARPVQRLGRLGDQPIWITEVASTVEGGDKAAWVRGMFDALATPAYRRVQAVVWFDLAKERDWRMTSSAAVARAFASG